MSVTPYDEVPYESQPVPQTHPDRLAALAALFRLDCPSVRGSRVLEIGCATGGNVIALAEQIGDGAFVGVDPSTRQIEAGRRTIEALGLTNVRLIEAGVGNLDEGHGTFDFILCHGVYSWVPRAVQEQILAACRERLRPDGIALVSYNTLPGWRMRGTIRDLMRQYSDPQAASAERVRQARAMLDFLAQSVPSGDAAYSTLLRGESALLRNMPDSYIFHEHLEEANEPVYFREFAQRAAAHGLQYFADAELSTMMSSHLPQPVLAAIDRLAPDLIAREQLLDFLGNRMFRHSLLVHAGRTWDASIDPRRIDALHVAAEFQAVSPRPDLRPGVAESFRVRGGATITTSAPLSKAAFVALGAAWPASLSWPDLQDAIGQSIGLAPPATIGTAYEIDVLRRDLLQCFASRMASLGTLPSPFTTNPGERPKAGALARYQAESSKVVTSLRHESVTLDDAACTVLRWLDGETPRDQLRGRFRRSFPTVPEGGFERLLSGLARAGLIWRDPASRA